MPNDEHAVASRGTLRARGPARAEVARARRSRERQPLQAAPTRRTSPTRSLEYETGTSTPSCDLSAQSTWRSSRSTRPDLLPEGHGRRSPCRGRPRSILIGIAPVVGRRPSLPRPQARARTGPLRSRAVSWATDAIVVATGPRLRALALV